MLRLNTSRSTLVRQSLHSPSISRQSIQSTRSYATTSTPTPPKLGKSIGRRILSPIILSAVLFYSLSVPLGFYSLRYRDFLVETVPLGELLGDALDKFELKGGSGLGLGEAGKLNDPARRKGLKETELTRYAESKAKAEGWSVKKGEKADPVKAREEIKAKADQKAKELAEISAKAKANAGLKASEARSQVASVVAVVEEKAAQVKEATVATIEKIEAAMTPTSDVSSSTPSPPSSEAIIPPVTVLEEVAAPQSVEPVQAVEPVSTKLIFEQRPRELDATPIPPKKAKKELYSGPPLPLGFEPAPGFELPRPVSTAPKGSLIPPPTPIAPLPLVAPTVTSLASSEPILGQLAKTIDTLAMLVSKTSEIDSTSAAGVLKVAQNDIETLASRLETIKKEENEKLELSLKGQAQEYSNLVLAQEKELVERLDLQEEDWKKAFDDERKNLVGAYREKLEKELETQQEIINQRLREEVIAQGIELQRRWVREIKVRVEEERGGRLSKLEELEGGIRKLETVTKENEDVLSEIVRSRKIFAAVRAVSHAVATGLPFSHELNSLQRLVESTPSTSLSSLALSTVPFSIASTGISSFTSLSNRFHHSVAPQLKRSALLPEHGGVLAYLTSWLASNFLFQKEGWAEGEDVISIVARASYWLENKDLDLAAREVNSLKGWPKTLAEDWLEAARRHLEVRFALEIAEAEATAENLKAI